MPEQTICRICGARVQLETTEREINNYPLYICPACKTVLALAKPSDDLSSEQYNELFSEGDYQMHRQQFDILSKGIVPVEYYRQRILKEAKKIILGRKVVEIGGGVGAFGLFCVRNGWDYIDFDLSDTAVEYARKLGLNATVIQDPTHLVLPSANIVAMWEVIEHIWNVHEYLCIIRDSLLANGFLILSTPNYDRKCYRTPENWSKVSSPPIHVNFFTEEAIVAALYAAGFTYVKVIKPRFYKPSANLKSIWYNSQIAFGTEPTKTLYVIARVNPAKK